MKRMLVTRELGSEGPVAEVRPVIPKSTEPASRRTVTVNLAESPLTWLHARGHLTDRQLQAGERLRADWERAQLSPGLTMRWDPVRIASTGDCGLTGGERQIAARARFDGAIAAAGRDLSDVLWRVVCAGETLADTERALVWPVRSGKLVLRFALDRVADYYRVN